LGLWGALWKRRIMYDYLRAIIGPNGGALE